MVFGFNLLDKFVQINLLVLLGVDYNKISEIGNQN